MSAKAAATSNVDVTVIIVSWNTKDILYSCLKSVYEHTDGITLEVIVVDNASNDGSASMVKKEFPQTTVIENSENRGFAAADNQGIAVARGRYVLLLNSDTMILDKAIQKTVSFANAHLEAAVVGCRVLNPNRTLQPTCFMFPSILNMLLSCTYLYKLFPKSKFFGRERMTWWDRNNTREVNVVTGCFMLVRQEAIEQVGSMDEQFFMYGEETDWCYRFKQTGWKVMFTPVGEIIHWGGQSTKKSHVDMLIQLRTSILQFMKKHCNWFTYRLACFLVIFFFLVRIPVWACIAVLSKEGQKQALDRVKAYGVGLGKTFAKLRAF